MENISPTKKDSLATPKRFRQTMTSISITKTIPGDDLWNGHEDEKHHEPRVYSLPHPPQSTTVEHANRRFLKAIVDHWDEREKTSFMQDITPIMKDYLILAATAREVGSKGSG